MINGAELAATIVDGYNRRDLQSVVSSYTPYARVYPDGWDEALDVPSWLAAFEMILTSFPDLAFTTEHIATGRDLVVMELRLTGINTGPFHLGDTDRLVLGTDAERLPPTGRAIDISGVVVLETAGALVATERHYWKLLDTLRQLGLVESRPRGPARA
jgi:SnoaL-like polyketide cyclase